MSRSIRIAIPYLPARALSPNGRAHPLERHRHTQRAKQDARLCAIATWRGPPAQRVRVTPTLCYRVSRRRDMDNATASLKPFLDGLVGVVVPDDSAERLLLERLRFAVGQPALWLDIEELAQ